MVDYYRHELSSNEVVAVKLHSLRSSGSLFYDRSVDAISLG